MAVGTRQDQNGSCGKFIPIRYLMAVMGSIGLAIIYGFKVNISIAIVAMVNHTALKENSENYNATNEIKLDNSTANASEDGPFVWDKSVQGQILSAYFIGYLISMIPGARMAELVSAKWVMNVAVLLNVVASVLSPVSAHGHYLLLALMRVIQGIGGGVSFPAMHVMVTKWGPPSERNVLASIIYAGTAIGTLIAILLSGLLAANLGWVWVFYIEGALCLIWCTAWWLMIEDSPEQQKRFITEGEKDYILNSMGESGDNHSHKLPVPWGQIFKSPAFLAIFIAHFCSNFGWYMLLVELPSFMNQVLGFKLESNATLSALPYLCMWIFTMLLSKVLSLIVEKKWITVTLSRKIGTFFSSVIPMICLLVVALFGQNRTLAVVFMTIGVTCMGGMYSGFLANHIDIAPNFAGTLVALTNCFATIPGIIVPLIVGYITESDTPVKGWNIIFFVTAGILMVEIIVYWIFGSGDEQSWNKVKGNDEEPHEQDMPLKQNCES
ncbi:hypothetical protein PV326_008065 [Microctonus aethiopoides]|nr:hypothetical protein PV326_008065 [Microctonus aethiopoides]